MSEPTPDWGWQWEELGLALQDFADAFALIGGHKHESKGGQV